MLVAMATQFITTLIANRFLLAIGPECANNIVLKHCWVAGGDDCGGRLVPPLQSKVARNTSDAVFEKNDYTVRHTIEIKRRHLLVFIP
jgi:hypothetical protein